MYISQNKSTASKFEKNKPKKVVMKGTLSHKALPTEKNEESIIGRRTAAELHKRRESH